jgi:arsenate reductase
MNATKPTVLFVCIENSCRSQLAEALGRMAGLETHSAGTRPSGVVNAGAIASMAELGYDLATHQSESIDQFAHREFDATVTMGCGDDCAHVRTECREAWPIPDPKGTDAENYARVRDDIASRVEHLARRLLDAQAHA